MTCIFTRGVSRAKEQSIRFGDDPDYDPDLRSRFTIRSGLHIFTWKFYQRCASGQGPILYFVDGPECEHIVRNPERYCLIVLLLQDTG